MSQDPSKKESIFDQASKSLGKKAKRPRKKKPASSVSEKAKVPMKDPSALEPLEIGDAELEARYTDVMKYATELAKQVDSAFENLGMTRDETRTMLSNPNNFTEARWEAVQKEREALLKDLFAESADEFSAKFEESKLKTRKKLRKGKMLGARKKWIPMR